MGAFASRPRPPVDEEAARASETAAQAQRGLYFGPHFVMGGQRFATSNAPETFLFGGLTADTAALSSFGMSRIPHPMPDLQATTTVKSFVNLKKSSLHLVRDPDQEQKFGLTFKFDCDRECVVSVYFIAKESTEQNSTVFTCLHENTSYSKGFPKGMDQTFTLPPEAYLDVSKFPLEELLEEDDNHPRGVNSIAVLMEARGDSQERANTQSQSTYATLTKNSDGIFDLKVTRQRVMVDGVSYILQEIFGIEHSQDSSQDATAEDGLENTRECVVCMSDPKDTIALPCRHMCLCSQCAEQLRFQSNKCPICRQPFHSLLQIKIGEPKEAIDTSDAAGEGGAPVSFPPVIDVVVIDDKGKDKAQLQASPVFVSEVPKDEPKQEIIPMQEITPTTQSTDEAVTTPVDAPESSTASLKKEKERERKPKKSKTKESAGEESFDELDGTGAKKPRKSKSKKESAGEESFDELDHEHTKKKKKSRSKTKESAGEESFDELDPEAAERRPKKSRTKKPRSDAIPEAPEPDQDIFSGEEPAEDEKPKRKKKKKALKTESTEAVNDE